jgi:hypothetical protein
MHWPVAPKSLSWWGKVDISLIVQQAHCYFCQVLYLAQNGQRYFTLKLSFNEFIFFSVKSCWFHYCVFKLKTLRSLVKGKRDWAKSLYIVLYKERGAYLILCTVYKMCTFEILKKNTCTLLWNLSCITILFFGSIDKHIVTFVRFSIWYKMAKDILLWSWVSMNLYFQG